MKLGLKLGLNAQRNNRQQSQGVDSILSGVVAGYSLRYINSSYTGDVVLVERSSDNATQGFTPTEITDGTLTAWVGPGNNGYADLYDQFGSNNAIQVNNCLIVESGVLVTDPDTGLPAIKIRDSDNFAVQARLQISPPYTASQQYIYCFSVFNLSSTPNNFPKIIDGSTADRGFLSIFTQTTRIPRVGTVRSGGTSIQSSLTPINAGQCYLRVDSADRVNIKTRINGIEVINAADNNSNFNMPTTVYIGNGDGNNIQQEVFLSELFFSTSDESGNVESAEDNINSYYNIY